MLMSSGCVAGSSPAHSGEDIMLIGQSLSPVVASACFNVMSQCSENANYSFLGTIYEF